MFNMRVDANITDEWLLEQAGLEPGGLAQQTLARSVIDHMMPYWAYDTGTLANSAYGASDFAAGEIVYDVPYAQEMYYGIRTNGMPVNYHYDHNPMAGAYPFERMIADHMEDILAEVRAVVGNQ